VLETIGINRWQRPFADAEARRAQSSLELGKVLYFPNLAYSTEQSGVPLFSPLLADQRAKNISYDTASGSLKATTASGSERTGLQMMMADFSAAAMRLVLDLLPSYRGGIEQARASYRPVEIAGRQYSRLKDDKLLHVDAFPSTPTRGRRILRLFSNIDPSGRPRVWHIGEPFERFAKKFLPTLGRPSPSAAWFLAAIGATRGRRTAYDQLMLGLHNSAKRDRVYQQRAPFEEVAFPAGSTWLCFTDQVLHAAVAGQYALEQTFYVDFAAMADPASSPLRTLERIARRRLC
jgi:3-deoxy-D-manno-oct-2-ulosonic acid (Kdo) hydroxylase